MAYIGAPPPDRILTTEDIEAGAVEMSDISWKNQSTNENLSGTIDSFTVKLAEKFTLTGDIAISKDLTLTKLADDGEALVLTTDASSRTIEGSGTISSNTFAQVPNASLTSMTGVLGSGVTGGSGINALGTVASGTIGSGVDLNSATFPTGMPLKVTQGATITKVAQSGAYADWTNFTHSHTMVSASNQILLTCSFISYINGSGMGMVRILEGIDGSNYPTTRWESTVLGYDDNTNNWVSFQKLFTPNSSQTLYWKVQVGRYSGTATIHWGGNTGHSDMDNVSSLTIMEIAG